MTTLLVATTGGHLAQLFDVAGRLPEDNGGSRVWCTHENAQSRSLLAGEDVEWIPYIGVKDVPGVLRTTAVAHRLLKQRGVHRAVSTGSGIALAFLPYLTARGVRTHYIESAARVEGPSISGRVLNGVPGVRLYTQYRRLASGRWRYGGSVFDGFRPVDGGSPTGLRKAVVTLGTAAEFPFRRLLEAAVPLLAGVETLWQTGGTPTGGLPIEAQPWLPAAELADALAAADVVITHAGVGSALTALRSGRCPVLVPRETARGEAGDDHQEQLAHELAERGLAVHRRAEDLTVDDLLEAASRRVQRVAHPPTFELVP
jgi:UDP-N-acetylglucosamine--N-acetylmuramyl-(pentapeptide) pyrophosphoryl-undecaprenol N-acetylglucosamine transferase